jgi:hypothetical protein
MRLGKSKQPYCFEVNHGELFAFAGLWDRWRDPSGQWSGYCLPLFRLTISEPEHSVWSNWGFQMSARLRTALFTMIAVAAVSALPRIDLPETAFDERDVPTIQAVVMTGAASSKYISSEAPSAPTPFARICNAQIRIISPAYTNQSSDSRQFRELLSTLRC